MVGVNIVVREIFSCNVSFINKNILSEEFDFY